MLTNHLYEKAFPSLNPPPGEPGSPHRTATDTQGTHREFLIKDREQIITGSSLKHISERRRSTGRPVDQVTSRPGDQVTYADTEGPLLSMCRSPRSLIQQEWTTGTHGSNCSSRLNPMSSPSLPLSHDALGVEVRTGLLKDTNARYDTQLNWYIDKKKLLSWLNRSSLSTLRSMSTTQML